MGESHHVGSILLPFSPGLRLSGEDGRGMVWGRGPGRERLQGLKSHSDPCIWVFSEPSFCNAIPSSDAECPGCTRCFHGMGAWYRPGIFTQATGSSNKQHCSAGGSVAPGGQLSSPQLPASEAAELGSDPGHWPQGCSPPWGSHTPRCAVTPSSPECCVQEAA